MAASVVERESGARDEIANDARDHHLPRACRGGDASADVDGDSRQLVLVALAFADVKPGETVVDLSGLKAMAGERPLHLTRREYNLLAYLAERRGSVVHRRELLREVWGYADDATTRAVDYAIKRLRKKIEPDPHKPQYITAVHGDGYCLIPDDLDG